MTKSQRIFLSPPHMGGEELVFIREAFESNYIAPLGPQADAFEREFAEYLGIKHCLALSSGTAVMHLALEQLGIGPGDEVFASTLTFIGSVTPITFQGATPVFIDADKTSWNIDPALLESELKVCSEEGKLPKAVIPTDLYGQCCDYERIFEVCDRFGVPVVMDAAEAMGAMYYSKQETVSSKQRMEGGDPKRDNDELGRLNSELRKKLNNKTEKYERPQTDQFKIQNSGSRGEGSEESEGRGPGEVISESYLRRGGWK